MKTFENLKLASEIVASLHSQGFDSPTEIQERAIPMLLNKTDLVGLSQTGTGKTLAFLLPIIQTMQNEAYPQALVLCPTRELAEQILLEARKILPKSNPTRALAIFGGTDMQRQIYALKRGANLIIGTPGRVLDHIKRKTLKLGLINSVVLDEADEMLNMGFRSDIESILSVTPTERQTIMFSATMNAEILSLTKKYMRSPRTLTVGTPNSTISSINQSYFICPKDKKKRTLNSLLHVLPNGRTLIFCNTKKMVDSVQVYLNKQGYSSLALHGDMPQPVRKRVMNEFKLTPASILITTDIAARGIDVADIISVINFDLPQNNEYYIHRVGRTGRAGKDGNAYTLLNSPDQVVSLKEIEKKTKSKIVQSSIVLDSISEFTPKKTAPRGKRLNIKSREKRSLVFAGTTHNKTNVTVHSDRKIGRKPRTIRHTHKSKIHF